MWLATTWLPVPWWLRRQRICLQYGRPGFDPWVRKILWWREWQPTPVFLPGEFHGPGSVQGYSPWGRKVSVTTERLTQHFILLREGCSRASLPGRQGSDCCLVYGSSGLYVPVSPEVAEDQPFSFLCLGSTDKMLKAQTCWAMGQSLGEVTRSPSQGPCHLVSFAWHPRPAWVLSRFSHVQLLCNSTDCSSPGSSVHGILQGRILEWAAMPSCRGSRDRTHVSYVEPALASGFFTTWEPSTGDTPFLTCYWKQSLKVIYKISWKSHLFKTRQHFWPLSLSRHSLFSFWTFPAL